MKNRLTIQPVLSEKSYTKANAENKYTFLVPMEATKLEVARAIETQFKVKVVKVNSTVKLGKIKRDWIKRKQHRVVDTKKMIVQLKKGDKIESFLNIE